MDGFFQKYKTIEGFLATINYDFVGRYGCGAYGCVFGVKDKDTEQIRALKITEDSREADCMYDIIASDAWEKTKHIPRIYVYGSKPIEIIDTRYSGIYYIREELADVPSEFWIDEADPWKLNDGVKQAIRNIREKTELCLPDPHMENWGFRARDLEAFASGKLKTITYVLRDIACNTCSVGDPAYDKKSVYDQR